MLTLRGLLGILLCLYQDLSKKLALSQIALDILTKIYYFMSLLKFVENLNYWQLYEIQNLVILLLNAEGYF